VLLIEKVASKDPSLISFISYVILITLLFELQEVIKIIKRRLEIFLDKSLFNPSKFNKIIIFGTYNVIIFFKTN